MLTRRLLLTVLATSALGCQFLPLPNNPPAAPRPAASDFPSSIFGPPAPTTSAQPASDTASPMPGQSPVPAPTASSDYDPFSGTTFVNADAPTKFDPLFNFSVDGQAAGSTPAVTTNVYQTKGELEVREVHMLVEHANFHFEKAPVGAVIGGGVIELGTPPKLTLPLEVKVEDTDGSSSALVSVRSNSALASVYVADLQIKSLFGSLVIISLANAARANDANGVFKVDPSARVVQTINAGLVQLPSTPQRIRTRVVVTSEPDPSNQAIARRVFNSSITIQ